jgi:hypothetical protein
MNFDRYPQRGGSNATLENAIMTPALMGLTLAGWSEVSPKFKPSVAHHVARFLAALALAVYLAASVAPVGG